MTTSHTKTELCNCEQWMRSACAGETLHYEGKYYCILHVPFDGKDPTRFNEAFQRKIDQRDFHFPGAWFPDKVVFIDVRFTKDANFSSAIFRNTVSFFHCSFEAAAHFSDAKFEGYANFGAATFAAWASFSRATFSSRSVFTSATFRSQTSFDEATFAEVDFTNTVFAQSVRFSEARFNGTADFSNARIGDAQFGLVTFKDRVRFAGSQSALGYGDIGSLDFQFAQIEKPEKLSFHTVSLRPHWFVNIDPRKFEFSNVEWQWHGASQEIGKLRKSLRSSSHRMLGLTCRQLAVNAEENHRYDEASRFRYMAMDARRLEHWQGMDFRNLSWWYWLASGYGERIVRAAAVLLGIFLFSAALYTQVGFSRWEPRVASEREVATAQKDEVGTPLKLSRALTYSAAVMTFQRPEPRPATTAAQTIVLLETILGPVQAALLALAIRRKFMR